jgi:hypothetical protein
MKPLPFWLFFGDEVQVPGQKHGWLGADLEEKR